MNLADIDRAIVEELEKIQAAKARIETFKVLRLQFGGDRTNIGPKVQTPNESVRQGVRGRRGRPTTNDHRFLQALAARGSSLAEWARQRQVDYETAKGWVRTVDGRRIPRKWADAIEVEFTDQKTKVSAVPATLATWKNGIR